MDLFESRLPTQFDLLVLIQKISGNLKTKRRLNLTYASNRMIGHPHPHLQGAVKNYAALLQAMGKTEAEIRMVLSELGQRYGVDLGGAG